MALVVAGTFSSLALLAGTTQATAGHVAPDPKAAMDTAAPTITTRSILGVRLGISDRAVRRKLGRPSRRANHKYDRGYTLTYAARKVSVDFGGNRRVIAVETASRKDRTADGVGPGATIDVPDYASFGICRARGRHPICVPDPYADPQTVLFLVPRTGRIRAVSLERDYVTPI